MEKAPENIPRLSYGALTALVFLAALIAGAAFAGWSDYGAEIFLTMASNAWAYCF